MMSTEAINITTNASKRWYLFIAGFALTLDQFTKYWVTRTLGIGENGGELVIIRNFFNITYTENRGIAFGMLGEANLRWILVAISFAAIFIVVYYMFQA